MPAVFEHIHFRKQKKAARSFKVELGQAIAGMTLATPFNDTDKLSRGMRNRVYQLCQMHDQNQTVLDVYSMIIPGSARCAGDPDWCIYYARDVRNQATNVQLLMLGRIIATTQSFEEFFDFRISEEDEVAFQGTWVPEVNQSVNMNYGQTVVSDHDKKHFGMDRGANQYDIGADLNTRLRIVRGLEEKAIAHGAYVGSEAYFMFDRKVGYEGTKGPSPGAACVCIRVDTPGLPSQHSHPIPIDGVGGHDDKVRDAIRYLTVKREDGLPYLVRLAKYLTIIGTPHQKYRNLRNQKALYSGTRPPECVYWTW
jgi:hypothetical protein